MHRATIISRMLNRLHQGYDGQAHARNFNLSPRKGAIFMLDRCGCAGIVYPHRNFHKSYFFELFIMLYAS